MEEQSDYSTPVALISEDFSWRVVTLQYILQVAYSHVVGKAADVRVRKLPTGAKLLTNFLIGALILTLI